jgi:hypothetical protein
MPLSEITNMTGPIGLTAILIATTFVVSAVAQGKISTVENAVRLCTTSFGAQYAHCQSLCFADPWARYPGILRDSQSEPVIRLKLRQRTLILRAWLRAPVAELNDD